MPRKPREDRAFGAIVNEDHPTYGAGVAARSAYDNRPGLSNIHFSVMDKYGQAVEGLHIELTTMPSKGMIYPVFRAEGVTDEQGYAQFPYRIYVPGGAAVFQVWVDGDLLIDNLTTVAIPYEYPIHPDSGRRLSNRPTVGPAMVTYDAWLKGK